MTTPASSSNDTSFMRTWGPTLVGYLIAGLLAWGLLGGRVSVVEATSLEHGRRITILEVQSQETTRVLSRIEAILERMDKAEDRREGK